MTDRQEATQAAKSFGEQLVDAEFAHDVTRPRLLETHISWVLLTGSWAYKIKKPVRFDFLDYSTTELRERHCWRELEINQTWAPRVYHDVVPIFAKADAIGLRIGTRSEVARGGERLVDHAVKMVEFPQSALLSARLAAGQVETSAMEVLGRELARLHQRLPEVAYQAGLAKRSAVEPARQNLDYLLAQLSADSAARTTCEQLQTWTRREAETLGELLESRARLGFIRECHGDLHLDNLLQLDGRFVPFDGIEFNDAFRQIEGWNEIAFLAMELSEHGYSAHSRRLVDAYAEASSDYAGLALLRYFLVYRALVRAKVDLIREAQRTGGNERSPSDGPTGGLSQAGQRYLDYALEITRPNTPELWLTHGVSGSGKSTQAAKLVERRGHFRLRSDVQRKLLAGLDPWQPRDVHALSTLYADEMTNRTYDRLKAVAEEVLRAGWGVVVDATFLTRAQRRPLLALADELRLPAAILVCCADEAELTKRLEQRQADPSDATVEVLRRQFDQVEPPTDDECDRIVLADEGWEWR